MRSYANNDGFGVQFSMDATMEFKNGFDIIEDLINWPQDNQVSLALDVALLNNKIRACIAFEGTRFCTGKCEGDADCVSRPLRPLFFRLLLYRTKLTLTRFSYYRRLPKLVTTHLKYAVRNVAMGANVEGMLDAVDDISSRILKYHPVLILHISYHIIYHIINQHIISYHIISYLYPNQVDLTTPWRI